MEGDMKVIRMGRRCLLAFLILGAITATTASARYEVRAMPELGRCVKVAVGTGGFKGSACITHESGTKGQYEFMPASAAENITFEGAGTEVVLASSGHPSVKCIDANVTGTLTGPKTATAKIEMQGCENTIGQLCHSVNAENQIVSLPLEANLGFIKHEEVEGKLSVKVGLDFKAQSPFTQMIQYECKESEETATVEGSVIATDKPINKMASENKLVFHVTLKGQDPEKFQEGLKDTLSTTFAKGLASTTVASTYSVKNYVGKYSIPLEIKARES
jgi:hypothetical protein